MFKVNNKETRTTPLTSVWCLHCYCFEHISHRVLLLTLSRQMPTGKALWCHWNCVANIFTVCKDCYRVARTATIFTCFLLTFFVYILNAVCDFVHDVAVNSEGLFICMREHIILLVKCCMAAAICWYSHDVSVRGKICFTFKPYEKYFSEMLLNPGRVWSIMSLIVDN